MVEGKPISIDYIGLPENVGDIYFHSGKYHIGSGNSNAAGGIKSGKAKILLYLLANPDKKIGEEELKKVTGLREPLTSGVPDLRSQINAYSNQYLIELSIAKDNRYAMLKKK